jgi:Domain of unknown function (DUF929)
VDGALSEGRTAVAEADQDGTGPAGGRPTRSHTAVFARLAVGIVVAVGGAVVLVKVVGGSSAGPRTTTALSPTSATVLAEVTGIPPSVDDAVGVDSPTVPIVAPAELRAPVPVTAAGSGGRRVPVVVFVGAEYCAFCAAERWPLIAALSRFGTFHRLYDVQSSSIDFAPDTPTFSFYDLRYDSAYVSFRPYEVASDVLGAHGYGRLMTLPRDIASLEHELDRRHTIPFVDVGGRFVAREAALSPITFVGVSRDEVAGSLTDATNPITVSIVASANYLSATICSADGEVPIAVCDSSGVRAADDRLKLRTP